jgi:hypothetical protein
MSSADRVANEAPAGPKNACDFAEKRARIRHVLENHHRGHDVEVFVRKRYRASLAQQAKPFSVPQVRVNPEIGAPHFAFCGPVLGEIGVDAAAQVKHAATNEQDRLNGFVKSGDVMQIARKDAPQERIAHRAFPFPSATCGGGAIGVRFRGVDWGNASA